MPATAWGDSSFERRDVQLQLLFRRIVLLCIFVTHEQHLHSFMKRHVREDLGAHEGSMCRFRHGCIVQ